MYKLLLLDIDGTLRDERYGIPNSAKRAIRLCQKNGCKVVICTGRSMGTISDDVFSLDVDGYIAGGGCYISMKNEILCDKSFSNEKIARCLAFLRTQDTAFTLETKEKVYMNEGARVILEEMNRSKRIHENVNKQFSNEKIVYEDNIGEYRGEPVHKICLWSSREIFEAVEEILTDEMEITQEDVKSNYYEIIQRGYHKGNAIQKVCEKFDIAKNQIISFGDGQNDIEMFKASSVGVAMKKSHPKLKEVATSICEDVMEDGIYQELKRRKVI